MIALNHYLLVSAFLFMLGMTGVVLRRDLLTVLMSLELILNAANLSIVAFSRFHHLASGQILVFFVMAIAAAEVAVGLALVVALFRARQTLNVRDWMALRS